MKRTILIGIFVLIILISGCGSKYACLDGKIVKDKSKCSTQCGNCKCESLETKDNCPQDCDENYYRTHLNEGCPSCAPLWDSIKGTCVSGE